MESRRIITCPPFLHDALGPLVDELRHPDVVLGRLIKGAGDDLGPRYAFPEVRDLLGPLVNEEDDDLDVGLVLEDGVGDLLEEGGLPGLGRGHDEPPLSPADGGQEVYHPGGKLLRGGFQPDLPVGELGDELVKAGAVLGGLGVQVVDRLHLDEGPVALVLPGGPGPAHDVVPAP
jgi:hypothetical protein